MVTPAAYTFEPGLLKPAMNSYSRGVPLRVVTTHHFIPRDVTLAFGGFAWAGSAERAVLRDAVVMERTEPVKKKRNIVVKTESLETKKCLHKFILLTSVYKG